MYNAYSELKNTIQSSETDVKLEIITSAILHQLMALCIECNITSDIIDMQSFICYPKSPTYVTYRTRLLGTSETDSGLLISLIEAWVSNGDSITVTGILVRVDSECSVAISSLSEGECSQTQPSTTNGTTTELSSTDYTVAIIGGVVAVIIVLIVTTIIVIVIVFILLKNGRGELSTEK